VIDLECIQLYDSTTSTNYSHDFTVKWYKNGSLVKSTYPSVPLNAGAANPPITALQTDDIHTAGFIALDGGSLSLAKNDCLYFSISEYTEYYDQMSPPGVTLTTGDQIYFKIRIMTC
jgi:hypothetical protein